MKTGQLAMMMIVGIVLFILAGLVLYLSKINVQKQTAKSIQKTQDTAVESLSFKDHVQQCLDRSAKVAIKTLGKQGGYIYSSQGGSIVDFSATDEGVLYIRSEGYQSAYNILPAKINSLPYSSEVPIYPWQYFPHPSRGSASEKFDGIFGVNSMPPLRSAEGPVSIQGQIEDTLENNVGKCIEAGDFTKLGYNISMGSPKAEVVIGSKDVSIRLEFPIVLDNPTTSETISVKDFSSRYNFRLRDLYVFAKDIINKDASNIKFRIDASENNKDGFSIQIIRDAFNSDDIIKVTDEKSLIEGRPLEYVFARKNRAPALYYIMNDELEFPQGFIITRNDVLSGGQIKAEDPDEDQIAFSIKINGEELTTHELRTPEAEFVVEASDASLVDYQAIKVTRSST